MAKLEKVLEKLAGANIDIDALEDQFAYLGIRVQEETYGLNVGDKIVHNSSVWVDGVETDEELDGVCATNYNGGVYLAQNEYFGRYVLLLGDNRAEYGEDDGEIIMYCPTVLAIWEVEED